MRRFVGRVQREDGVAAVEFAIVASILLILVFGIVQFGLALSKIESLENAARQGGREAVVAPSAPAGTITVGSIKTDVVNAANPYVITNGTSSNEAAIHVFQGGAEITSGTPCSGVTSQTQNVQLKVSWTQQIQINIPFLPNMTVNHDISATFRCEPPSS